MARPGPAGRWHPALPFGVQATLGLSLAPGPPVVPGRPGPPVVAAVAAGAGRGAGGEVRAGDRVVGVDGWEVADAPLGEASRPRATTASSRDGRVPCRRRGRRRRAWLRGGAACFTPTTAAGDRPKADSRLALR